jgi:broad specificity phosphatase PhoE
MIYESIFKDASRIPSDIIIARHGRFAGKAGLSGVDEAAPLFSQLDPEDGLTAGLDEVGRQQAAHLGAHLLRLFPEGITVGVRSDYAVVEETAAIALPEVKCVVDLTLRERNRGDVGHMTTRTAKTLYPVEAVKEEYHPLYWQPPHGQSLHDKATAIRARLPEYSQLAPDQPLVLFTSGEVVIAARTIPELGNVDEIGLKYGLTGRLADGWPALAVDNAQFDVYSRRHPKTGQLSGTFDHMLSVRAGAETATDSGWISIRR